MGDVSEEVESLSSNRAAGTLNPSYNILKRGAFSEDNLRLAKWIRRTGERRGEKEKRGEELETEEGGEVGLRSRRKSWLITSLQRDDRFPTSRGERERQTEKEREANLARQHRLSNLSLPRYTLHDPLPACIQAVYVIRYFGSRSFMTNYVLTVNASVNRLNHSALNCREFFITFFLSFFFASSLSLFLSIFRQQQQLWRGRGGETVGKQRRIFSSQTRYFSGQIFYLGIKRAAFPSSISFSLVSRIRNIESTR